MATETFQRPQTPATFWHRHSRTRHVFHVLRQGKYVRRSFKFAYRASTAPVVGTSRLTSTAWKWIRADDYAATEDHVFREKVRTRRRRTAWMVGGGYLASTAVAAGLWNPAAPLLSLGALASVGTAVEVRKRVAGRPLPFKMPGGKGRTPAEGIVVRAAIDAKLGRAEGMRLASPVLNEDAGWSTILQLPPGQRARDCLGKEAAFASALGVGESQVVFELVDDHAGRLVVYVAKSDPFLKVYTSPLLGRTEPLDFWQGVPAGMNGRGQPERLRLVDASLLVAGEPRAGKSAAVNGIIGTAALAVTPKIHLWDGKGAGDHRPWRRIAHTAEKRNAKGLLEHLHRMQAQMERVFDMLDDAGGSSKLNPELCRQFGVDVELTIVDETRYYVTSPFGGEIVEAMVDIASRGPAAGVLLVLATQRMTKDAIPPELKGVCSLRWAMRCPDVIASNAVLGPGAAGAGYDASDIPRSHRGVGILDADGSDPVKLRSYFLDDAGSDLADVAAAAYELRRAAGTLPEREQPVDNTAELQAVLDAFGEDDKLLPDELAERLGWDRARLAEELVGVPLKQIWRDGGNAGRGYRREDVAARADR
jgi:S-DNA-T family DNA segregation ATPase FtsK/SpoIIIE